MPDELARSTTLIERLLADPSLRSRFRADPAGVLAEYGVGAETLSAQERALLTLELRESRSSLAGATFAAAVDGLQAADLAAHAAPGLAHEAAQELGHLLHSPAHHGPVPAPAAVPPAQDPKIPPLADPRPAAHAQGASAPPVAPSAPASDSARSAAPAPTDSTTTRPPTAAAHVTHAAHPGHAAHHPHPMAHHHHPQDVLEYPGEDASSRQIALWMGAHAAKAGLPPELPVMAALTESGLRNLSYGDHDSLGYFQMRTSIWNQGAYAGYPVRPALQLQWFIDRALAVRRLHAADPSFGRDPSSWGEWVAEVEQPAQAYRGRYQTQLEAAQALVGDFDFRAVLSPPLPLGLQALQVAQRYVGLAYDWGGSAPQTGFDCSGLVQFAYAQVGIHLPRVAADQFHVGTPVARADLQPGDAVFFADPSGDVHHVGLYIGDGRFINAPASGQDVRVDSLSEPYFAAQYAGARRYALPAQDGYARTLPALGS